MGIMIYVVGDKHVADNRCSEVAQWWSRRLLTARSRVRAPPSEPIFLKMPIEGENPRGQKAPVKLSARSRAEHERSGFSLRSKRETLPRSQFFSAFSRLYKLSAGVAELADAQDLKSCDPYRSYRFDPGLRHQFIFLYTRKYAGIIYKDLEYNIIDIAG